jgi:hypothetical protein
VATWKTRTLTLWSCGSRLAVLLTECRKKDSERLDGWHTDLCAVGATRCRDAFASSDINRGARAARSGV